MHSSESGFGSFTNSTPISSSDQDYRPTATEYSNTSELEPHAPDLTSRIGAKVEEIFLMSLKNKENTEEIEEKSQETFEKTEETINRIKKNFPTEFKSFINSILIKPAESSEYMRQNSNVPDERPGNIEPRNIEDILFEEIGVQLAS